MAVEDNLVWEEILAPRTTIRVATQGPQTTAQQGLLVDWEIHPTDLAQHLAALADLVTTPQAGSALQTKPPLQTTTEAQTQEAPGTTGPATPAMIHMDQTTTTAAATTTRKTTALPES